MSTKFSFSISKTTIKSKVDSKSLPKNISDKFESTDYILSVEDKLISSKVEKVEKDALVIPLIKSKRSILLSQSQNVEDSVKPSKLSKTDADSLVATQGSTKTEEDTIHTSEDTITKQAVDELLQDAKNFESGMSDSCDVKNSSLLIPIAAKPKEEPTSFISNNAANEDEEEEPDDANYDDVPITDFGTALLRGMGWKPGQGIGKHHKEVKPVQVNQRPKGLGLGADASVLKQQSNQPGQVSKQQSDGEDKLAWKPGGFCQIVAGRHVGLYGEIEGFDGDDGRVFVRLTLAKTVSSSLTANVKLVTAAEYKKYSKYLNKIQADSYKEQDEKRMEKERVRERRREEEFSSRGREAASNRQNGGADNVSKSERGSRKEQELEVTASKSRSLKSSTDASRSNHKATSRREDSRDTFSWLLPRIRVRIIDKHFEKGRYYKQKVEVVVMASKSMCTCRTESGRLLEGLSASMLETVIPREMGSRILVVRGSNRGQDGELIEKDSAKNSIVVRLFEDEEILTFGFDDVCELIS